MGIEVRSTEQAQEAKRTLYQRAIEQAEEDLKQARLEQERAKAAFEKDSRALDAQSRLTDNSRRELASADAAVGHANRWLDDVKYLMQQETGAP